MLSGTDRRRKIIPGTYAIAILISKPPTFTFYLIYKFRLFFFLRVTSFREKTNAMKKRNGETTRKTRINLETNEYEKRLKNKRNETKRNEHE